MDKNPLIRTTRQLVLGLSVCVTLVLLTVSCKTQTDYSPGTSTPLAEFTKNSVSVSIQLERDMAGNFFLAATFSPIDGYHLYSKDIPREGVDGIGRPTLLEVAPNSKIQSAGDLIENLAAQTSQSGPNDLLIYPAGPVTMKLPILLPDGEGLIDENISITYMTCSGSICKPPVENEIINIKIPGNKFVP
jgi:hypothetical protein